MLLCCSIVEEICSVHGYAKQLNIPCDVSYFISCSLFGRIRPDLRHQSQVSLFLKI